MFYDLNVKRPHTSEELKALLTQLTNYGFAVVAVTTNLDENVFKISEAGKKSKKNLSDDAVPPPVDLDTYKEISIKIINRINITISNVSTLQKVHQSKNLKTYDIISFLPSNTAVLKALKDVPDFDILSFNPTIDNPPLFYNRKLYNQFVNNGVYFELPYGPAIADATHRKYIIYTSSIYHAVGKSNNILVTSAAELPTLLRGPYDIINLCVLFGLNEEQAKNSITRNCADMLRRARTRRRGRSTMEMVVAPPPEPMANLQDLLDDVSQESQNSAESVESGIYQTTVEVD